VLKQLRVGLATWSVLGSNLITSRESLEQLIRRGDGIVMNLQEGKGTLGKLLTDRTAVDELEELLLKANRSMDELQVTLNNIQQASANLQQASTHLPAIGGALGTEAKDLSGLILQTQQTLHEIERLVAGLQRHWLIRKHIQSYRPETRIPPSEVAP
jgi:phospholipid/cholesterol/gamma-HCH transport system substrate-binding protein